VSVVAQPLVRDVLLRDGSTLPLAGTGYDDLDPAAARALIAARLEGDGASWLGTDDAAALLATHGIATVESHRRADVEGAVAVAEEIGARLR
jgi:hypothetical protein